MSKNIDKVGFYGGIAVYLLAGIPLALAVALVSAGSWSVTDGGEKFVRKWISKLKGRK